MTTLYKYTRNLMNHFNVRAVALLGALCLVSGLWYGCGSATADCTAVSEAHDKCYGVGGDAAQASCESCGATGVLSTNQAWIDCYLNNGCTDTNDTDNVSALGTCLGAEQICE